MVSGELRGKTVMVFVTGYYLLEHPYDRAVVDFVREIKGAGAKVLFDPGPLVSKVDRSVLSAMIEVADIMTPNEEELAEIAALLGETWGQVHCPTKKFHPSFKGLNPG